MLTAIEVAGGIDALAIGLPALVSPSGGNVGIVQDGRVRLLFAPDNANDLAQRRRSFLQGRTRVESPTEIREFVRHRTASAVVQEYCTRYEDVVSQCTGGRSGYRGLLTRSAVDVPT